MKRIILALMVILLLVACSTPPTQAPSPDVNGAIIYQDGWGNQAIRVIDDEAAIVCYLFVGSGISCLPLSETMLDDGN